MKLLKLELFNFRQFYGKNEIVFSTHQEKNITLIHAENGVGKTAILNSIIWCFYGSTTKTFERPKELLNKYAKQNDENRFYVYIDFEESGINYQAQRVVSNLSSGMTFRVFEISSNGSFEQISNPDLFINSIIPREMADYFFFEGEGVGNIIDSGKNIKSAVEDILGFTVAKQTLKDLNTIKKEYRNLLDTTDCSSEFKEVQKRLIRAEDDVIKITSDIESAKDDAAVVANKFKSIDDRIKNSDSNSIKEQHAKREKLLKEKQTLEERLFSYKARKASYVARYAVSAFCVRAANEGISFIDEKQYKGTLPEPYNVQLVKDIINNKRCICNRCVEPGTDEFKEIHSLLAKAGDPKLANRVTRARSQLTAVKKELKDCLNDFKNLHKDISNTELRLDEIAAELALVSSNIKDVNIEAINRLENDRSALLSQLLEANKRVGSLNSRQESLTEELKGLKLKEKTLSSSMPEIDKYKKIIEHIDTIIEYLSSKISDSERSSLLLLAQKINDFLSLYVMKDYHAKLSDDYSIVMYDKSNRAVAKSKGESLLLSLTFISSLISISRMRKGASGHIFTPGAIAPFVVDAPFGVLGNAYKSNIADQLPKSVDQIIFLLSSSHWEGTVEEAIRNRIGFEYNLVLEVSSPQGSKSLSPINILGADYDTARYDCNIERTIIEEVGCYV